MRYDSDNFPPCRNSASGEAGKGDRLARGFFDCGRRPGASAVDIDIQLYRPREEHDGATRRFALPAGKADCPLLKQKYAATSPLGLAYDPSAVSVAPDIEQRNCCIDRAGIRPRRKFISLGTSRSR